MDLSGQNSAVRRGYYSIAGWFREDVQRRILRCSDKGSERPQREEDSASHEEHGNSAPLSYIDGWHPNRYPEVREWGYL